VGRLALDGDPCLTYANIGVYDTALFANFPRTKLKLLPLFRDWIGRGLASGERYDGPWANVGTPDDLASLDAAIRQRAQSPDDRTMTLTAARFFRPSRFDVIRAAHVAPAIDTLIADARATVERVAADPRPATWNTVVEPLTETLDRIDARGAPCGT